MTTSPLVCPSCGVPWKDHLGMTGTCAKLQKARERAVARMDKTLEEIQ
jgi:hypothetical protein